MRRALPAVLALLLVLGSAASPLRAETLVVANKSEATVSLVDLASGEVVATLPTGDGPHEVAVSPDGRLAVVTDYGDREAPGSTLTVLDVAKAKPVRKIQLAEDSRPHGVEWLDDRRVAVTAEGIGALLVVDVESGETLRTVGTGQDVSHMVAVTADGSATGRRAYVANIGSGSVSVIDLDTGELVKNVVTGEGAEGIDLSSDGRQLWITNREADTVVVLDPVTLEVTARFDSPSFPIRARAAGDRILVTHARSGELAVFATATPAEVARRKLQATVRDTGDRLFGDRFGDSSVPIGVVTDADGARAWIAHANADVVTEVDLETLEVARELTAGREPDGMAWSPLAVER